MAERTDTAAEVQPQETVQLRTTHREGWLGNPLAVTLDLMPDGTVRWRDLHRSGITVLDQPGEPDITGVMAAARGEQTRG
jgi:hypothetical protein